MRYRATLAYDGTAYQGFQRQIEGVSTIQAAVESAITRITQQAVPIVGAGRTDTGVHAEGQVIAFDVEWRHSTSELLTALNAVLPDDIALQDLCLRDDFHPRFDARSRTYRYTVLQTAQRQPLQRSRSWQIHKPLAFDAMQTAAALLVGEHDFAAFGNPPQGVNTVRVVFRSEWQRYERPYGAELVYVVEATAFLHHMVRRMVGMQVDVGAGRLGFGEFEAIFRSRDLARAKTLAPPQGLVFANVRYDDNMSGAESDKQ